VYDVIASVWELLVDMPTGKSLSCFQLALGLRDLFGQVSIDV
jgi:hypothetical protein